MTYVDTAYINVARKNEMQHHKRTMDQLSEKIAQLNKAVAWEVEQHRTRLEELERVEGTLNLTESSTEAKTVQPTLEPTPSTRRRCTKSRKYLHRSMQKPASQLVG